MAELTVRIPQLTRRRFWLGGAGLLCSIVLATGAIVYLRRATGLAAIAPSIDAFTPYYFRHNPPDGYVVNRSKSTYSSGILQITLAKPGASQLVLAEQTRPSNLTPAAILTTGTQIRDAAGPAIVTSVEGRVVGTMLPAAHDTLILINAPAGTDTADVTDLLKSLQPLR